MLFSLFPIKKSSLLVLFSKVKQLNLSSCAFKRLSRHTRTQERDNKHKGESTGQSNRRYKEQE